MIALTGATGRLGRLVANDLLQHVDPDEIVAIVRRPDAAQDLVDAGVQVRHGDYDDPGTLAPALKGVDRLLLISSGNPLKSAEHHSAVIDAAKVSGVGLLVYTSLLHADRSTRLAAGPHARTEPLVRDSGIPWVILRNGVYTEQFAPSVFGALATGKLVSNTGTGGVSSADRIDLAEAASIVLRGEGYENTVHELAGDETWTFDELANALTQLTGKPINNVSVTSAEQEQLLLEAGANEVIARYATDAFDGVAAGEYVERGGELSRLLGHPTMTLRESLANLLKNPPPSTFGQSQDQ